MSKQGTTNVGKILLTILLGLLCLAGVIFGYWHIITGWNGDNAIFHAFKQIDAEEGWFRWAVVKGGMQWAVGGLGFYFMATPILLLISIHTNGGVSKLCNSFATVLVGAIIFGILASIPGILFNTMSFYVEEIAILGLIFGALGLLSLIPAGGSVLVIVVSTATGSLSVFKK